MPEIQRVPVTTKSYVGLDMSLSATGFCIRTGDEIRIETVKTKPDQFDNDLARLKYIVAEIMKRIPRSVGMICIEDFFTPGNAAQIGSAIKLAMLGTATRLALYDAGMPFFVIAPGQLKKWATSSGASQKSLIVMSVYKTYGIEVKDDNQADALVLAHIARALDGDTTELPKYQHEVLGKVKSERPRYNVSVV
jgi:Holliday junction resolvasome RuvABC endonuclease subunit